MVFHIALMDLTEEPESIGDEEEVGTEPTQTALPLIDENQWAVEIRQQKCVKESEIQLRSRIDIFLEQASDGERKILHEERDKLWKLMKQAKAKDDERNPTATSGPNKPISQKFKEGYNTFLKSGHELSKHLDLFVGQAPEYVSLAWGAIKILMIVQISNEDLKEGVHSTLSLLVNKFDLVDHLPEYMPQKNLIAALAEAYSIFSKFLAKAIEYYSECRALRYLKAFTSPWNIRFQGIVDEIDVKFRYINDIATAQSHIIGYKNLVVGQMNFSLNQKMAENDEKMLRVLQNVPQQLQKLEDRIRAITFENVKDILQTMGGVQQRLDERFAEPCVRSTEDESAANGNSEVLDDVDLLDIFTDLRDLEEQHRQSEEQSEQMSGSHQQKAKRRNMLQSEKVIAWIESEESQLLWIDGNYILSRTDFLTSFSTPLAIDAACNYESIIILKFFSAPGAASRNTCPTLLQALIAQLIKQHPRLLGGEGSKLTRSTLKAAGRCVSKLWEIFASSISDLKVDRVYIIIDGVDELGSDQDADYQTLMSRLNALIEEGSKLIKVLLTARLLPQLPRASEISNALSIPQRKWSLIPFKEELPSMQHKFSEIREGRCKDITFPEIMLLYPPKTVIFTKDDGEYRAFVVYEISGMVETTPGRFDPLHLRVWSIDHNGKYFTKRYRDLDIGQFSGRKLVTDLRYVPAGYLPNEFKIRTQLAQRGRRYWHAGTTPGCWAEHEKYAGPLMVDLERRPLSDLPQQEYDDQLPEAPHSQVKPLTLILCPASITAYSLNRLKWVKVKVSNLREAKFNPDVFDRVTLSDEQKNLLYVSVKAHVEYGRENNRAESIARKQTGLIMWLHGPPSSGKSMAIDAIAQRFRIPLFTVDASRLTGTMDMEAQLQEYLELALRWNAIVLFRKADQFVAKNAASQQGNLQYLFLRELESYTGIVALTTNRAGRMNEEFTSLVTLIFQFDPACDYDRMKIWENVLDQLDGTEIEENVKDYIREDNQLKSLMLNGRQIRNLIITASSIAKANGRKMGAMELEVAVGMTRNFMSYMSAVRSDDKPSRAE